MTNQMNHRNGKTRTFQAIPVNVVLYATLTPPTITFPCKDIRSINDVRITCDNGFVAVPIARVHNVVQFRIYKQRLNFAGPVGGAAVTIGAAGNNVLEAVGGPFAADTTTMTPVEIPDGAVNMNAYGLAIGVR